MPLPNLPINWNPNTSLTEYEVDRKGKKRRKLGLGDGAGPNVIVKAEGFAKHVIAHSLSQPEPSFRMNELYVEDEEKRLPKTRAHARGR
jgi:hypothetical protein